MFHLQFGDRFGDKHLPLLFSSCFTNSNEASRPFNPLFDNIVYLFNRKIISQLYIVTFDGL